MAESPKMMMVPMHEKLEALTALHAEQKRWSAPGYEEWSYDSLEEAYDSVGPNEGDGPTYWAELDDAAKAAWEDRCYAFSICRECARIEMHAALRDGYDGSVDAGLWPCPTMKIILEET